MTKYQDTEASAYTEVNEVLYSDTSAHLEVPEDHEVPVSGAIDEGNTQNTPEYVNKMDLDV